MRGEGEKVEIEVKVEACPNYKVRRACPNDAVGRVEEMLRGWKNNRAVNIMNCGLKDIFCSSDPVLTRL